MKKTIQKTVSLWVVTGFLALASFSTASAQYEDWTDQPASDYIYNPTSVTNSNIDYGFSGCVGCDSSSGWIDQSTSNYIYNPTSVTNSNIDYGYSSCVGCNTPTIAPITSPAIDNSSFTSTYIPATYSNTDTFTSTYIPATYAPTTYGVSGYSYPTYTSINYGNTGNYGYSNYGYVGNYGYSTGGYTNNTTSCPSGSTLTNGTCVINTTSCPSGSTLVNGTCTVNTTSCPSGSTLINGVCTVTNTNTTTNYVCSNGSVVTNSSQCPVTYTNSTYTYPTTNYSYQTQYKTCGDGSYIPVNQACYYANQNVTLYPQVIAPPVVKTNNVVTSIATQITNTSGRCNGIGLIANGVSSNGWFEYGETSNLGRTTASTDIGRSVSAPFSNLLAGLKPSTKYYCRAVMQNQYGVVKGEIVSFITNRTSVAYVQPTVKSKYVAPAKVVTKKVNMVTCSDGSSFEAKNQSQATILNNGDKLVTLQVEKSEGNVSPNSQISYRVVYRNLVDSRLTGVVVKIVLPTEFTLNMATVGNYDATTHTLTLNQDTLDAHSEGIITISGTLTKDAPIGKTIVTTAYAKYTVPGSYVQDEVTAYVVSSITPSENFAKVDTGAKKVIGNSNERGFMPNNLVEWLALVAIMFIIFILGRSIYLSYQEGGDTAHH